MALGTFCLNIWQKASTTFRSFSALWQLSAKWLALAFELDDMTEETLQVLSILAA